MMSAIGTVANTAKAPRARLERIDHHQRQHGQKNDADEEDAEPDNAARDRPDLGADHLSEGLAVPPRDRNKTVMSCTAPANTTPTRIQIVPGR